MLTMIFGFLTNPIGKIIGIAGVALFAAISLWGMVKIHDAGVRREALAKFNAAQMEQVIKSQKEFIDQTKRIEDLSRKTIETLQKTQEELNKKLSDVEHYLTTPEARKSDRKSSNVLKQTIKRLGEQK